MGTKQILPTRFLHLPEVTSPGQTMNLQHISRCGKQTNHFPNFLPEEKENGPFLPPRQSFLPRCPRFFPALADLIHRSHNSAPWLDLRACQLFWGGGQPVLFAFQKKALSCSSGSCVKSTDSDIYTAHSGFRIRVSTAQKGKWGSSPASRDHNIFFYCTIRHLFRF